MYFMCQSCSPLAVLAYYKIGLIFDIRSDLTELLGTHDRQDSLVGF